MYLKKNILIFVFISFALYSFIGTFHSAISFDWSLQDWLINYEGGFVRRGFSGQFISFISNNFFELDKHFYFGAQIHAIYFFLISFFYIILLNLLPHFFTTNILSIKELNI